MIKIKNDDKKIRNGDIVNIHWKNRHGYRTWGRSNIFNNACPSALWNWGKVEDVDMPGGPFEIVIVDSGIVPESNLGTSEDQPKLLLPAFDFLRKI